MGQAASVQKPFLTDVKTLRERARKNLNDGAIGSNYVGDVNKTIEILQSVLATELVCVLRYTMHSIAASGISSESVKEEFATHVNMRFRSLSASTSWAANPISIRRACSPVPPRSMSKARIWWT